MPHDRDARLAATIARGSGLTQPAATLVVRQLGPVVALLARDDATVRRVLDDPRTRQPLVEGVRATFRDGWRRATMERLRRDHDDWLDAWWWPVCSDAELAHLLAAPALRPAHHRVGWRTELLPASSGAAELLLDPTLRRDVGAHLVVERRLADAVRRRAEVAATASAAPTSASSPQVTASADEVPEGIDGDEYPDVGWWST